jgi:hypothetical protein
LVNGSGEEISSAEVQMVDRHGRSRHLERIRLGIPILAKANAVEVVLVDFSLRGCGVESHVPFRAGSQIRISFDWSDQGVDLTGEVVRCKFHNAANGTIYHTGVVFEDRGESAALLKEIVGRQLERALEEQKANARGELAEILEHMPIFAIGGTLAASAAQVSEAYEGKNSLLPWTRIARQRGYVKYSYENGRWRKLRTTEPEQPLEGFTVWAYEDEDHLDKLSRVYETAAQETQTLIRLCAELSLQIDDTLPPQRFTP